MQKNPYIFALMFSLCAIFLGCSSSFSQCDSDKKAVVIHSLEYHSAIYNGARGHSVPGRIEAISALANARKSCGNPNLTYQDIYVEALNNNKGSSNSADYEFLVNMNTSIK